MNSTEDCFQDPGSVAPSYSSLFLQSGIDWVESEWLSDWWSWVSMLVKSWRLHLLTQMVNRRSQWVNGSNVIDNLQAKLYGFHRSVCCGLAGELVVRWKDGNYPLISLIYLLANFLATSPVIKKIWVICTISHTYGHSLFNCCVQTQPIVLIRSVFEDRCSQIILRP